LHRNLSWEKHSQKKFEVDSANAPGEVEITWVGCLTQSSPFRVDEKMSKPNKEHTSPSHTGKHEKISDYTGHNRPGNHLCPIKEAKLSQYE
jgi:hypothetical protein